MCINWDDDSTPCIYYSNPDPISADNYTDFIHDQTLQDIFAYLRVDPDIFNASLVCRKWKRLCDSLTINILHVAASKKGRRYQSFAWAFFGKIPCFPVSTLRDTALLEIEARSKLGSEQLEKASSNNYIFYYKPENPKTLYIFSYIERITEEITSERDIGFIKNMGHDSFVVFFSNGDYTLFSSTYGGESRFTTETRSIFPKADSDDSVRPLKKQRTEQTTELRDWQQAPIGQFGNIVFDDYSAWIYDFHNHKSVATFVFDLETAGSDTVQLFKKTIITFERYEDKGILNVYSLDEQTHSFLLIVKDLLQQDQSITNKTETDDSFLTSPQAQLLSRELKDYSSGICKESILLNDQFIALLFAYPSEDRLKMCILDLMTGKIDLIKEFSWALDDLNDWSFLLDFNMHYFENHVAYLDNINDSKVLIVYNLFTLKKTTYSCDSLLRSHNCNFNFHSLSSEDQDKKSVLIVELIRSLPPSDSRKSLWEKKQVRISVYRQS